MILGFLNLDDLCERPLNDFDFYEITGLIDLDLDLLVFSAIEF